MYTLFFISNKICYDRVLQAALVIRSFAFRSYYYLRTRKQGKPTNNEQSGSLIYAEIDAFGICRFLKPNSNQTSLCSLYQCFSTGEPRVFKPHVFLHLCVPLSIFFFYKISLFRAQQS